MIRLVLSTDIPGFAHIATVLSSILRRTESPVWVRVYTRGFDYRNIDTDPLKVEFIRCDEEVTGSYPRHVNQAVFDRLRIIRDFDDWDRVLVLDHDMLVFTDLAEYFTIPFEDNLLMGRLFGPGNTVGLQMSRRGGLPEGWRHASDYPYFYMGPMMNLALMRRENFWETLVEAHAAIGQDEQISLTAASGGRVKGVDKKWNLVPTWDNLSTAGTAAMAAGPGSPLIDGVRWSHGVPEGLVHWTGPAKPWHHQSKVWRAQLWESEMCGWEQLRLGHWRKPSALEIEPADRHRPLSLIRRGWRVETRSSLFAKPLSERHPLPGEERWPDLRAEPLQEPVRNLPGYDLIRFGPHSSPLDCFEASETLPDRIVLEGPRDAEDVLALRSLGYRAECRILRKAWPGGGPHPKVLSYQDPEEAVSLDHDKDLYLSRLVEDRHPLSPERKKPLDASAPENLDRFEISENLQSYLKNHLARHLRRPRRILELGPGTSTGILAGIFPQASIISLENQSELFRYWRHRYASSNNVTILHAPFDPALSWYDLTQVDLEPFDLLFVDGPLGLPGKRSRMPAICLRNHIVPGGLVILDDTDRVPEKSDRATWLYEGFEIVEDAETFTVLRRPLELEPQPLARANLGSLVRHAYVVSLPERQDRRDGLRRNWENVGFSLPVRWVDGVRPEPSEIRWTEMKGMEAYHRPELLRKDYIVGAVGCKRAGIRALETFLGSGEEYALICQDDCRWIPHANHIIDRAFRELPDDWEMAYFSASARQSHQPFSPHLIRLGGARLCTAILWKRESAARALALLKEWDGEMDLLMEKLHASWKAYGVIPMPAYQAESFSNISGQLAVVNNR